MENVSNSDIDEYNNSKKDDRMHPWFVLFSRNNRLSWTESYDFVEDLLTKPRTTAAAYDQWSLTLKKLMYIYLLT